MAKITISDLSGGFASIDALNAAFQNLEDELNNKVLYRNNPLGEPNSMQSNLDMNGKSILNISTWEAENLSAQTLTLNGELVVPSDLAISALPDFTGNDGKYLKTDGITASWQDLSFIPAGNEAVTTTVQSKLRESISVKDFGAVGDGVTNDTVAIQAAADAATAIAADYMLYGSVPKAPTALILVPAGNYVLTSQITSTAQLVWNLHPNAVIAAEFLTGVVKQEGKHINAQHTGGGEHSTTFSIRANTDLDVYSGVYPFAEYGVISSIGAPHSVGLQITQTPPDYITLTGTTYTANSVTYTNELDLSNVKTAATITSQGSLRYTGVITDVNQATKTITVEAWRPYTGRHGDTGTPTNGDEAAIDYFRTVWGQNSDIYLKADNPTTSLIGYEMTVRNELADAPVIGTTDPVPYVRGFYCRNFGPYKGSAAFHARATVDAPWRVGLVVDGAENGIIIKKHEVHPVEVGVSYRAETGIAFESKIEDTTAFSVSFNGNMEIGRTDAEQTTQINLHSSGTTGAFDCRIQSEGGSALPGNGILGIFANTTKIGRAGGHCLEVEGTPASVNYVLVTGAATTVSPTIQAQGKDDNIDLRLIPKGTGKIRFGSWVANADEPVNGYITIKDSGGTTRKLATIA